MRTAAVVLLVLILGSALAYLQGKSAGSSSGSVAIAQAPPAGDGAPLFYFPQKEQYVTRESDPFLILVGIKDTSPSDIRFVLLKPTPGFVQLRPLCSSPDSTSAQTLVSIAPQPGDAGKYEVSLGSTRGDAEPAAPFLRLIVKVKR